MDNFNQNHQFERIGMYTDIYNSNNQHNVNNIENIPITTNTKRISGCGTSMSGYYKTKKKIYKDQIIVISILSVLGIIAMLWIILNLM